jgi:hypothetical protein
MAERGNKAAIALCEALGIPHNKVRRVELVADAGDILAVNIYTIPTMVGTPEFADMLQKLADDPKVVAIYDYVTPGRSQPLANIKAVRYPDANSDEGDA